MRHASPDQDRGQAGYKMPRYRGGFCPFPPHHLRAGARTTHTPGPRFLKATVFWPVWTGAAPHWGPENKMLRERGYER